MTRHDDVPLRPVVDLLEDRRLLSAVLGGGGVLTVKGTATTQSIVVTFLPAGAGIQTSIDGVTGSFALSAVKSLVVNGGPGYETITVQSQPGYGTGTTEDLRNLPITVDSGNGGSIVTVDLESQSNVRLDVNGGSGDDLIGVTVDGAATVHGGAGDDTITVGGSVTAAVFGDAGNDSLTADGAGSVATLSGGDGNDTLTPGFGVTATLSGGAGDDLADLRNFTGNLRVFMDGSHPSTDSLSNATLHFDGTVEEVFAGSGNDLISGTAGNNVLRAGSGNDTLIGLGGNDTLYGGAGPDTLLGGDGDDVIISGGQTPAHIDGGPGIDTAYSNPGDTVVYVETNVNSDGTGIAALSGTVTGTDGSYHNQGNDIVNATDGELQTYFDAPTASGGYVEESFPMLETISQISFAPRAGFESRMVGGMFQGSDTPDFSSGVTTLYTVTTAPAAGTLTPVPLYDHEGFFYIRYIGPACGWCNIAEMQLFGFTATTGLITGTVDDDVNGDQSVLTPIAGVKVFIDLNDDGNLDPGDPTTVSAADGSFSFRYVQPGTYPLMFVEPPALQTPNSYQTGETFVSGGQLAQTQILYHQDVLRTGTVTGPAGSFDNQGNTVAKAFDGSLSTFFDGPTADGNVIELALPQPERIDKIDFAPRPGFAGRMVGGSFELATSPTFATGPTEFLPITGVPAVGTLSTLAVNPEPTIEPDGSFGFVVWQYVRYISPDGSYGNIAEMQVFG